MTPRSRRARRTAAALLIATATVALLALSGAGAGAALADDGDSISIGPATDQGADTSRTRLSYQAAPGQHLDDVVEVRNTGTTPQTITVFPTDAFNTDEGAYGLLDTGVQPTDAGSWVRFADGSTQATITLDPGATQLVQYSLDVPADAAPGDHAAGIVASAQSASDQILVDRRVATRLYVRVPGDLQPVLSVSSITASYDPEFNPLDGQTTITYTVKNDGNVALGADMTVGVRTWFGIGAGQTVKDELAEMLPGSTRTISVVVPGVAQLGYLNPFVSLLPTVAPDAQNPGPLDEVSRDTVVIAPPWWLLAVLLVGGLVWLIIRMRRRSDDKRAEAWIAFTEEQARQKAEQELVASGTGAGARRDADGAR
ncbi:hypothetical protein [Herbiconiux sp. VKM Ac-2851]|uniref:hypothetical protein n=1 Tax=Herbiconiux sp. VKM Ac-2851 TaxID=2739025 RepID=UPI0015647C35|nr:hypothetical protein [Herbiconiux sp. VKM Ac-2851]NQX36546.1 hypothetical protein [Herbiconiux sp. VKM Ac-2851]